MSDASAREIAQCYEDIREKDAEIDRLKKDVESWKGAHSVASADRDTAISDWRRNLREIYRLKAEVGCLELSIERLKATTTDLQRECLKRGVRIADLERLATSSADALVYITQKYKVLLPQDNPTELIKELREAAK